MMFCERSIREEKEMCIAQTKSGALCKVMKVDEDGLCSRHRKRDSFVVILNLSSEPSAIGIFFEKKEADYEATLHEGAVVLILQKPKQLEKNIDNQGCSHILTRGAKKGAVCGKLCVTEGRCVSHQPRKIFEDGCPFILSRGPNKGSVCGRKKCAAHGFDKEQKKKAGEEKGCAYVFSGENEKDVRCGKRAVDGKDMCSDHFKESVPPPLPLEGEEGLQNIKELREISQRIEDLGEERIIEPESEEIIKHCDSKIKIAFESQVDKEKFGQVAGKEIEIEKEFVLGVKQGRKTGKLAFVLENSSKEDEFPAMVIHKAVMSLADICGIERKEIGDVGYNGRSIYVWSK